MEIICYGAGNLENPENTILAIQKCTDINENLRIQIDLHLTKDAVVILAKNPIIKSKNELIDISETSIKEIKKLNAAFNFKKNGQYIYRNNPQEIPTLEEVFRLFPKTKFLLELHSKDQKIVDKTIQLIESFQMQKNVIVSSKINEIITLFHNTRKDWNYAATTVASRKIIYENMFYLDEIIPVDSELLIVPKSDKDSLFLRERIIKYCKQKEKQTWTWIFENKDISSESMIHQIKQLKEIGVDGVFTSCPSKLNLEMTNSNKTKAIDYFSQIV